MRSYFSRQVLGHAETSTIIARKIVGVVPTNDIRGVQPRPVEPDATTERLADSRPDPASISILIGGRRSGPA